MATGHTRSSDVLKSCKRTGRAGAALPWYNPGAAHRGTLTRMSTEELLAEALRLPRPERARVAEELLSSLEESDEEVATAWAEELGRRSRDVAEGRVQTTSWESVRTQIVKELERRRADRTAS
jgi:putative addiction module component (TIGR02574 family)